MPASPAIPGLFLTFAATVLLVFVCVSTPVWNQISFLNVGIGRVGEIRYGVFGYTGSKVAIGYDFIGIQNSNISNVALRNLTKALILHPIAAGFSGLAFFSGLFGAAYHRAGTVFMTLFSALAALLTLVIVVIDLALFGVMRQRYRERGISAEYGIAPWLAVGALGALLFAFLASCCGVFGRYRKRKEVY